MFESGQEQHLGRSTTGASVMMVRSSRSSPPIPSSRENRTTAWSSNTGAASGLPDGSSGSHSASSPSKRHLPSRSRASTSWRSDPPMSRRFVDAGTSQRCAAVVRLRDGSTADCGRRRVREDLCTQHAKIDDRLEIFSVVFEVWKADAQQRAVELQLVGGDDIW